MPLQAILFDKDGTLIDFNATYGPAIGRIVSDLCDGDDVQAEKLARGLGCDPDSDKFRSDSVFVSGSTHDIARVCAQITGLTMGPELNARIDMLSRRYALASVTAFAGVDTLLRALRRRGLALGIATNDAERNTHEQLRAVGLGDLFDHVIGYDSGYGHKPQPGQIRGFARLTGADMGNIAMIGDAPHDLVAARAAGAIAVGVKTGPGSGNELDRLADIVIDDLSQLEAALALD